MIKKIIYDLRKSFNDIKKYEKTKTLHKDNKENLNDLNNNLLIFMINNY